MKKAVSIYFIVFLICGAIISCDSTWGKKHTTTYYFSQDFKDYSVFNTGSYWVYEDSLSKLIDSIYLFHQNFSILGGKYNRPDKSESLDEGKYASLNRDTLSFTGFIPSENQDGIYCESTAYSIFNINYFDGNIGSYSPNSNVTLFDGKNDSIIYNQKFYDVKIFKNIQQQYSDQPQKMYYARHVGLVRKELFNGQVWNLIRYKVSQ